jgi:site-specific DNA-methyltransferase (adenine-specific)
MCENQLYTGDSRNLSFIPEGTVDLVVTSPPYNVGIKYATHADGLPLDDYLSLLESVWTECYRVIKPGGRIAINVAGVDRKPYLPLHSFITMQMLKLGFMMRGEILWNKGASVGVSTAWGSWCRPSNPTLRDVHEYILVFSKGEWGMGHKGETDLTSEEFVAYTKSIWDFPTVSAKKVGHPAPFPAELPSRLIKLYTYKDDVVLDPFMGSGTTCQAAEMLGRRWIGVDMDPGYVKLAEGNMAATLEQKRKGTAELGEKVG